MLPGVIGCIVILMEEDNTPDNAVAHGRQVLNDAVQTALNEVITTLRVGHEGPTEEEVNTLTAQVAQQVEDAIADQVSVWDWLWGLGDMDDKIGTGVFYYSQSQILESLGTPFEIRGSGSKGMGQRGPVEDHRPRGRRQCTGQAGDPPRSDEHVRLSRSGHRKALRICIRCPRRAERRISRKGRALPRAVGVRPSTSVTARPP